MSSAAGPARQYDGIESPCLGNCMHSDSLPVLSKRLTEEQIARFYEQLELMHKAALLGVGFCTAVG
eukprot:COSAG01_NODE_3412_length_6112_cov_2.531354_1_plen_66_part_00